MLIGDPFYPCCTSQPLAQIIVRAPGRARAASVQMGATPACTHHHWNVPSQLSCGFATAYQPRRITAQDLEEEFVLFLQENAKRLFNIAYRQEGNYQRAQDALQTTAEGLWVRWGRIRLTVKNMSGYASSCVIRNYYDLLRKERSENGKAVQLRLVGTIPDAEYLNVEQRVRLAKLLKLLPPRQRDVLAMRHLMGMKISDIAAELQISVSTVGRYEKKAIALLREAEQQE
ncbi:RNA polymerase sigma factor [Streptomyces sp. NPDC127051]|uniref:RNA polymerase sigma factor n=1 Tax=Streptomyces sp. NPDC127051 TaxID=3347119 RepID=UPI003660702E